MNKIMRAAILAFALIAGFSPAIAQAPPPVPALPDAERRTSYLIAATTCICNVNFALYGDSTDYASWVEVYLNGVRVNFNDGTFGWTITSPTGALGSIPRPVTDAVLTFNGVQTGTVQIVGARRPRRTSTFAENRGVAARDLNQILNDMIAQNRETWDKTNDVTGRALMSQPGNTLALLPLPSACAGKFLGFDVTGLIPQCSTSGSGSGNVTGPISSTIGHIAQWNNTTGTLLADGSAITGNYTFSGDMLFASGRPWCDVRAKGAVGDGVTNDAAAFRSCVSALVALGGGNLYVPSSTNPYCVIDGTSGVLLTSTTAFIRIVGADEANSVLSACGNNSFPVVRMNTPHSSLENVYVLGYGMRSTDTFGIAANPAVHFQSLCSFCRIMNSTVNGGNFNVQLENSNYLFLNVTAQYAYSTALIYAKNGGGAFDGGNHFNQVWPVSVPAHNATLNAWGALGACVSGQVVSTAGFYIQYTGAGTTGAIAPTLKNYGQSITDGSCSAFLVGPTTYYGIQADSGVNEMQILHTDMTGAFTAGLAMTNTLATTAPTSVSVSESTIGQTTVSGIFASAGSELSTNNLHISRCIAVGCVGVNLTNSWSGPANITGLRVFNNVAYGVFIGAGTGANIANSYIYTADLSSITVGANINQFNILGSSLCTSSLGTSANAITVTAGTSNKYNIIGNDTTGCSSSGLVDNGSGTTKLVGGNGPWTVPNGGTGLQAGTSGGMPYFNSTTTMASSGALATGDIMVGGGTSGPATGTGCSIANASVVCASSVSAFPQFTLTNSTADAVSDAFLWRKNRSGGNTLTSDFLGDLEFYGFANAAQSITGRIQSQQTAASSGSNIPSKLIFSTSNAAGQINQTLSFDSSSHLSNVQATAPTVTAGCNGAGSGVVGTDLAGTVTAQTAAVATCTLTFGTAYVSAPNCSVSGLSAPLTGAVTVGTGTIVVNFAALANYKWSYVCHGA